MRIVTSDEMYSIEEAAEKKGITRGIMMENAGKNIANKLIKLLPDFKKKKICILCGKGNNGGDGLVAARYLKKIGVTPEVSILGEINEISPLAKQNLSRLKKIKVSVREIKKVDEISDEIRNSDIVIDAIFGTGFKGSIKGLIAEVIQILNEEKTLVISVDLPSGLNADTGEVSTPCVNADWTFTLGLPKKGLFLFPGAEYAGRIEVLDIGIPSDLVGKGALNLITADEISSLIPKRKLDTHKGSYGHVFIISGSVGMTGAATLTGLGALYSGAGLVTLGIPKSLNQIMEIKLTEVMTKPLPETEFQTLSLASFEEILNFSKNIDVITIGPGLGRVDETCELVRKIIENVNLPMVIDADAIFALKGNTDILKNRKAQTVLTPHPGEMSYLTGKNIDEIQSKRIEITRDFASMFKVITVLKGTLTVVASPGDEVWINPTGNPGMASGGVGDVLTGIIASLVGQKIDPFDASKVGVYIHGLAGDLARDEKSEMSVVASDIINKLPQAFKKVSDPPIHHTRKRVPCGVEHCSTAGAPEVERPRCAIGMPRGRVPPEGGWGGV